MLQAADGLFLDLPDALTGQVVFFPDFIQGQGLLLIDAEVHFNDVPLTVFKTVERDPDIFP